VIGDVSTDVHMHRTNGVVGNVQTMMRQSVHHSPSLYYTIMWRKQMSEVRIICSQVDKCGDKHCSHRHLHLEVTNCTQEACPNFDGQALCVVAEPTFLGDLVRDEED
jgi:hypothetical protein